MSKSYFYSEKFIFESYYEFSFTPQRYIRYKFIANKIRGETPYGVCFRYTDPFSDQLFVINLDERIYYYSKELCHPEIQCTKDFFKKHFSNNIVNKLLDNSSYSCYDELTHD
jgi:hypothetical protein